MSAVLEKEVMRSASTDDGLPSEVSAVIKRYLEGHDGLPTPKLVATICKDPAVVFYTSQVIRYFLIESPLRPRDLGALCISNDSIHAKHVCREATLLKAHWVAEGRWKPRWEEATKS